MSRITESTKIKQKRGTGEGADYKPWVLSREVGSEGTESVFLDWKHGRQIQCLSQAEAKAYRFLRWQDDVADIREQFPLDLKLTLGIAKRLNLPHPRNHRTHMTTDFLVTYMNPNYTRHLKAYSIKPNRKSFDNYAIKNLMIEKTYWNLKGIPFEILYADEISKILDTNIKECVRYYNADDVHNPVDAVKCLIARKLLIVDMESAYLNYVKLSQAFIETITKNPLLSS